MKKLFIGLAAAMLVFGIGTAVYAATTGNGSDAFAQMLPFMKQMHPNLTDQQLQDMYNICQTNNGNGMQQMMNNYHYNGNMMNFR